MERDYIGGLAIRVDCGECRETPHLEALTFPMPNLMTVADLQELRSRLMNGWRAGWRRHHETTGHNLFSLRYSETHYVDSYADLEARNEQSTH